LRSFAPSQICSKTSRRVQRPPAKFAVFSISISPVGARNGPTGVMADSMCFHVRMPPSAGTARIRQPEKTAVVAISKSRMWARDSAITSCPGCVSKRIAIWLPMVPVGTNSAASRPNTSAARRSSRLTVGSSPYTSSPTSAAAMAARISGVGRVTVSERRSMIADTVGRLSSMHAKHAARNILSNRVNRAPDSGDAIVATMQSDDQQIDFLRADVIDDAVHRFSVGQVSCKPHAFARCQLLCRRQELFVEFRAILFEGGEHGGIGAGRERGVCRKPFHHGDGPQLDTETLRKLNRDGQRAASLARAIVCYGNFLEHRSSPFRGVRLAWR